MRLLLASDLHGRHDAFARILSHAGAADAVLLAGDLTDFGSPVDAEKLVRAAAAAAPAVLAVAGNCDSAAIDRRLAELGVALHGEGRLHGGARFQGLSAMPPWIHRMYHFTEEEMADALRRGWSQVEDLRGPHVVVSHTPPRGTAVDRTWLMQHVGSTALREFLESRQPDLVVCGHIHEGRGVERLGRTTIVNCGHGARGEYAVAELAADGSVRAELCQI